MKSNACGWPEPLRTPSSKIIPRSVLTETVKSGPRLCENTKTLDRDRTSYSFVTALGARIANPINFEIEFENTILVALRVFEFSHSLGQELNGRTTRLCGLIA